MVQNISQLSKIYNFLDILKNCLTILKNIRRIFQEYLWFSQYVQKTNNVQKCLKTSRTLKKLSYLSRYVQKVSRNVSILFKNIQVSKNECS